MAVTVDQPLDAREEAPPARGRVVMLVDNGVVGDSRVQKAARSMAAAGWDVTLIGAGGPSTARTGWMLGDAKVRVVKLERRLATHRSKLSWSPRRPLAYSGLPLAQNRLQALRASQVDLRTRFAALTVARRAGGSAAADLLGRIRLLPARVAVKARGKWVHHRASQLHRLKAARENPASLPDRAAARFWRAVRGVRCWRTLDPSLWDFEIGIGPVVDRLRPDIIHANDHRMLGVAARAKLRAMARGRDVRLVWDAHEFVPGLPSTPGWPGWLPAQIAYEAEYCVHADAVVTVSPTLAELLRDRHGLPELPTVVANCPALDDLDADPSASTLDLRADCKIGADTPLVVYCGGISKVRGVSLMVEALPDLPGVHVAFVSLHPTGRRSGTDEIEQLARDLAVIDRIHVLPYVEHWQVVPYLSAADAAVSPLHHLPNHEIALSNKFFEYSHARLPLVVSDVRTMAAMVRQTGQGEVYRAGDRDDYLRAIRAVLADPEKYRAAYDTPGLLEQWTWQAQATVLHQVYERLMPTVPSTVPAQTVPILPR